MTMTQVPPRDAEMRMMVTCPLMPIPSNMSSHRGAQGVMYADQLRQRYPRSRVDVNWSGRIENYDDYDFVWIYHGNDLHGPRRTKSWSNEANLFGDVFSYPYAFNTYAFYNGYRGPCASLGIPMPRYYLFLNKKIELCIARGRQPLREFLELDMENVKRIEESSPFVKFPYVTNKLVVGDSHSICMYRPEWTVNSVPFKTLNGALGHLREFVEDVSKEGFDEIEFYFGNIDVRHHICRLFSEDERREKVSEMVEKYLSEVASLGTTNSVYELLPIEREDRSIPKTGWYDGKPFWGSWEERNQVRLWFRDDLIKFAPQYGVKVKLWTDYLQNPVTSALEFKFMEKPHSIHLSREFYPYWQGEDGKKFIKSIGPRKDATPAPRRINSNADPLEDLFS